MPSQMILERSFFSHGSDRVFVFSVKRHAPPGQSSFKYRIQGKGGAPHKKSKGDGSSHPNAAAKESSLEGMAAAAVAAAQEAAEEASWMALDDDDSCDQADELKKFKGLVLDLSYRPINIVGWKRALCLEILEKAEVLVYYDQLVCSPSRVFFIPAVLKMVDFVYSPKPKTLRLSLSRTNVFIRDKFKCQYCDHDRDLTIDHVLPVSKGGGHSWDNLVTACKRCNGKKGSRLLEDVEMKLDKAPKEPNVMDSRELPPSYRVFKNIVLNTKVPSEWIDYLPQRPTKFDYHRRG
ncbi:uncharacterized protein LOC9662507 [Selaginella moellendorffii]|nr:uncharacterized protein LOC9662507 [Selaginella moellendorffii]|eukprot:XP_002961695.2 uncharacterized protein LOC9662507 [Selaginella moellendorffii]